MCAGSGGAGRKARTGTSMAPALPVSAHHVISCALILVFQPQGHHLRCSSASSILTDPLTCLLPFTITSSLHNRINLPIMDSFCTWYIPFMGFPGGASGKEPACQCRRHKRHGFDPWVGKIPWRRAWQPTPVFWPGDSPWAEEPGRLQFIESQRVGQD